MPLLGRLPPSNQPMPRMVNRNGARRGIVGTNTNTHLRVGQMSTNLRVDRLANDTTIQEVSEHLLSNIQSTTDSNVNQFSNFPIPPPPHITNPFLLLFQDQSFDRPFSAMVYGHRGPLSDHTESPVNEWRAYH